jgi:hypothetical protein
LIHDQTFRAKKLKQNRWLADVRRYASTHKQRTIKSFFASSLQLRSFVDENRIAVFLPST